MHELSVTESILNTALQYAEKENAIRVSDIYLQIGNLSSIVDDCVQFYWDIISKGTICEQAILHFERIPTKILCEDCGQEFPLENELTPCPLCSGLNLKIISGDEFRMDSIEIQQGVE